MANAFDLFCDGLMKGTDEAYAQFHSDVEKQFTALRLFRDELIAKFKISKANHVKPNQKRKLDGINEEEDEDGSKKRICPFNEVAVVPFDFAINENITALEKRQHSTPNKDVEMPEGDISAIVPYKPRTKRNASVMATALNTKLLNEKLTDKRRRPNSREVSQQDVLLDKLPYVLLHNTQDMLQHVPSLPKNSIVKEHDKENMVPETGYTTVEKAKSPMKTDTTITLASPKVASARSTRSTAFNNTTLLLDVSKQKELEVQLSIMLPPMVPAIKPKRGRPTKKTADTTVESEHSFNSTINTTATQKTKSKRKPSTRDINTSEVANESMPRSTRSTRSTARSILEPPPPPPIEKPKKTRTKRGKAASASNQSELNWENTEIVVELPPKREKETPVTSDSDEFEHKKVKHVRPKRTRKGKGKLPTTPRPPTPPVVEFPPEEQEDRMEKRPSHDSGVSSTWKSELSAKEASNDATITQERMEVDEDNMLLVPAKVLRSSDRMETDTKKVDSPKVQQMNVSYVVPIKQQKVVLNETIVLEKVKGLSRATTVLSSPKQQNLPEVGPAHQLCNETITLSSNRTITIAKGELVQCDPNDSLLSDDLSEVEETPPRPTKAAQSSAASMPKIITKGFFKLKKEIYNESPVKSRVQHFERLAEAAASSPHLGLDVADGPSRATRTKTRAMAAKDMGTEDSKVVANPEPPPPSKKVSRSKIATPISARAIAQLKLPLPVPSSKQSSVKLGPSGGNFSSSESLMSPKPQHSMQSIVREDDALRKRDAMLQARSEEQRRKREEKSRAAAQARQQQTMLKQAHMEKVEKEKEEKIRQQQLERDERHREELEKKRTALEKKRAEEAHAKRKQQEENEKQRKKLAAEEFRELVAAKKLQEMKSQAAAAKLLGSKKTTSSNSQRSPIYKALYELGTDDESEDEKQTKRHIPIWSAYENRRKHVKSQAFLKPSITDTLLSTTKFTPNLVEIFPRIDKRKLVRSSSAHWRTPPRYSMMPKES